MVTVGCPVTVTRGLGTVGCACPPCAHSTVAPTWSKNPGTGASSSCPRSDDDQRTVVDGDGWANHEDAGAFAVLDVDATVVDHDHRARRALEDDAARRRRR